MEMSKNTQGSERSGRSFPMDPNLPSLLTSVAPEIRNQIYELLFVQEEPVEVSSENRKNKGNFEQRTSLGAMWREEIIIFQTRPVKHRNRLIRSRLTSALGLLRSCRQIHHEAASFMYNENHFTLFPRFQRGCVFEARIATISCYVPWLRTMDIDLAALESTQSVPQLFGRGVAMTLAYEILPILRMLWSASDYSPQISVTKCASFSGPRNDVSSVNSLLYMVGSQDRLSLRRYLWASNALASILTNEAGNWE